MNYTKSEQTEKKYTVSQAIESARIVFKGGLCLDSVSKRSLFEQLTLVEVNELIQRIITDSQFYD